MRSLAAPWAGMLESGVLLDNARHANSMARLLAQLLTRIEGIRLVHPVEGNAVFVQLPEALIDALHDAGWHFYTFIGSGHARFMCSWQTRETEVREFAAEVDKISRR